MVLRSTATIRPLRSVRLRVLGFTSDCFRRGETLLYCHYDSAISHLRRPHALGWCYPKRNNADGIALEQVRRLIGTGRRAQQAAPCLLMISDGQPTNFRYQGEAARRPVRQEAQAVLRAGVAFAHLQIGSQTGDQEMDEMYDCRCQRLRRADEIPAAVAELVLRWLDPAQPHR